MMWMMYAIGSAFFAGITSILAKIGIKNIDSNLATAIRTIVVLFFSWFMVILVGSYTELSTLELKTILYLISSGIATGLSWLCYFKALQLGNVNKVTPIDKSSTILTILLAMIFFHESVTLFKIIAILCMGFGTLLMIEQKQDARVSSDNKWMMYALLSAVFASLTSILGKVGIQGIESNLGTAIRTIVVLMMAWIVVFVTGKQKEMTKIDKKSWAFILISGLTTGLSWLCYYKALQNGEVGIVVSIDKLSILVTILFSRLVLKEKMSNKAYIGLCGILIGTFLLLL